VHCHSDGRWKAKNAVDPCHVIAGKESQTIFFEYLGQVCEERFISNDTACNILIFALPAHSCGFPLFLECKWKDTSQSFCEIDVGVKRDEFGRVHCVRSWSCGNV
jgi:hypothetical protein